MTYSCNWDFALRERYLSNDTSFYRSGITKQSIPKQKSLYNKELGLEVVAEIQITGNYLTAAVDIVRRHCPFQKERVKLYNKYFQALVLSINDEQHQYSVVAQNRLIKQLLTKLSDDEKFSRAKFGHKITLFGYLLRLQEYPDLHFEHIVVTKVILDGKVYE